MAFSISNYFSSVGVKRLSSVEVDQNVSNQHEFNGVNGLKEIFGTERISFKGDYLFLSDKEVEILEDEGTLTWYDARKDHPTRTEYRFYYTDNEVIRNASHGDLIVIARVKDDKEKLLLIIAPEGSTVENQLLWLFDIEESGDKFEIRDLSDEKEDIGFAGNYILRSIGVEPLTHASDYLDDILNRFGERFPNTIDFSDYARKTATECSSIEEPDKCLMKWWEWEEELFRVFEKHIVKKKLEQGFGEDGSDVDEFVSFSLAVHNRRKARAGLAFENHLKHIFDQNQLLFSKGVKTEENKKPDFLFPGISYYEEKYQQILTMLGVKTSAKDRWRQVLSEANLITEKHLITLEPSISKNQLDEMKASALSLVVPENIQGSYDENARERLYNLSDFILMVRDNQKSL